MNKFILLPALPNFSNFILISLTKIRETKPVDTLPALVPSQV